MENNFKDIQVVEVIYSCKECRGSGKHKYDPIRRIEQFYDFDGRLLMESDSSIKFNSSDMINFAKVCIKNLNSTPEELIENFL